MAEPLGPFDDGRRVDMDFTGSYRIGDTGGVTWVSKPVAESITEAMDRAPMGSMYEIIYASLAGRLKTVLAPEGGLDLLTHSFVSQAINFRSVNPGFLAQADRIPTTQPNSGAGSGSYHSKIWGPNRDERLPNTLSLPTPDIPYASGQDPQTLQSKGLLIAKLFADLQHHLPCVLFNLTSKEYKPMGIGGSSVTKKFYKDGKTVTELGYQAVVGVEVTAVTADDESTSNLQAIIEAAFGTLRDQFGRGATINGSSWQLMLPTKISPSPIQELDAPWAQGDDKGGKIYTATVGLDEMTFECYTYVARGVALQISDDLLAAGAGSPTSIALYGETDLSGPIRLKLGQSQKLVITGAPLTSDLGISQSKKVIEIRGPMSTGSYEVVPRRVGEATVYLFDTGAVVWPSTGPSTGRVAGTLAERRIIVTAV